MNNGHCEKCGHNLCGHTREERESFRMQVRDVPRYAEPAKGPEQVDVREELDDYRRGLARELRELVDGLRDAGNAAKTAADRAAFRAWADVAKALLSRTEEPGQAALQAKIEALEWARNTLSKTIELGLVFDRTCQEGRVLLEELDRLKAELAKERAGRK